MVTQIDKENALKDWNALDDVCKNRTYDEVLAMLRQEGGLHLTDGVVQERAIDDNFIDVEYHEIFTTLWFDIESEGVPFSHVWQQVDLFCQDGEIEEAYWIDL